MSGSSFHQRRGILVRTRVLIVLAVTAALMGASDASAAPSSHPFGILPGSFHVSSSTGQAGAHGDLTVAFDFAHEEKNGLPTAVFNDARTTVVEFPAGLIGNNTAVPTCTLTELVGNNAVGQTGDPECPVASQVGTISLELNLRESGYEQVKLPLYNMEVTSSGIAAQLGLNVVGTVVQTLNAYVRPGDSGITIESPNITETGETRNVSVTTWGLPASPVHDSERGQECFSTFHPVCTGGGQKADIPVKPFLSNPTSCEPHIARLRSDSWEEPESWPEEQTEMTPASSECERVPFDSSIEVQPTTRSAESSSGLNVSLLVPQSWENPVGVASAHLKDSVVTLPVGYTANPSLASGLGVCTPEQFERETASSAQGAGCPEESKIGTVDVETPVLVEKHLEGNIYIAKPFENPFGTLLGLYIVVKDPQRGIIVKLAGKIEPNETTGQLVTTFDGNPQVPFSSFTLKLRQGANSPLVSPPTCGSYTAQADLTPWSEEEGGKIVSPPQLVNSPAFPIETGISGGACPSGGIPPFAPGVTAGTLNNAAGSYSPFYLRIERHDGEQELTRFSTIMPPGLTGNLTGIPFCPEAAIETARQRTNMQNGGGLELAEPSCPAASKIGHTIVEAGVGTVLAQTPGSLYLAGPYHGAPLSLVSITSAKVGPFDLGTVVIRFALRINPLTAQVEVDATGSDPIPHIIKGIVVHVRNIRVYIDRPNFIINPTNCTRIQISNTIDGAGADFTNPADQIPVTVTTPFQAADCGKLTFKPTFKATTSGKTSRANGASLNVKVSYPPGSLGTQANLGSVKVDLPKQLPSRLTTLQKACPHRVFDSNPAGCPAESIVGHAVVHTQILPVPLTGPAYFVSNAGEEFPNLIIVLQGYGVTVDLVGDTFIKHGVTSSTFRSTPDTPFENFEVTLPEGKYSALAANGNLCTAGNTITVSKRVKRRVHGRLQTVTVKVKQKGPGLVMPIALTAQNGAVIKQNTPIAVTGCPKANAHKARKAAKHKGKGT